ncbi:MAG: Ig-like domain-containing protein [Tannerellaceae bacterium]|nr:Ig-like domain-containing protein [Tannerellaceae bacterium]
MKKQYILLLFAFSLLLMISCKTGAGDNQEETLTFHPYVEGFTTGNVSRFTPIRLVFNEDIPSEKRQDGNIAKRVKLKPSAEGEYFFEDERTLVFKPSQPLSRNTSYEMKTDLSAWFNVHLSDRSFSFRFTTVPFEARASLQNLSLNKTDKQAWDITVNIFTLDREPDELIESIIDVSQPGLKLSWNHLSNGKNMS